MPTNTPPEVESAEAAIAELLNAAGVGIAVVVEVTRLITVRDAALAAAVRRAALLEAEAECQRVADHYDTVAGGTHGLEFSAALSGEVAARLCLGGIRTLAEKAAP